MRPYTTPHLYHFVGRKHPTDHAKSVGIVRAILKSGCIAHDPRNLGWGSESLVYKWEKGALLRGELVVPFMVCFCDIPPESLGIHMGKYGRCAISIERSYLLRYQVRPVMYYPYDPSDQGTVGGTNRLNDIEALFRALLDADEDPPVAVRTMGTLPKTKGKLVSHAQTVLGRDFLGFFKPFDATLSIDDDDNFYMEREWRRMGNLCFKPEHVGHVIVPEPFVGALRRDYPEYADKIADTDSHANPPV